MAGRGFWCQDQLPLVITAPPLGSRLGDSGSLEAVFERLLHAGANLVRVLQAEGAPLNTAVPPVGVDLQIMIDIICH